MPRSAVSSTTGRSSGAASSSFVTSHMSSVASSKSSPRPSRPMKHGRHGRRHGKKSSAASAKSKASIWETYRTPIAVGGVVLVGGILVMKKLFKAPQPVAATESSETEQLARLMNAYASAQQQQQQPQPPQQPRQQSTQHNTGLGDARQQRVRFADPPKQQRAPAMDASTEPAKAAEETPAAFKSLAAMLEKLHPRILEAGGYTSPTGLHMALEAALEHLYSADTDGAVPSQSLQIAHSNLPAFMVQYEASPEMQEQFKQRAQGIHPMRLILSVLQSISAPRQPPAGSGAAAAAAAPA